MELFKTLFTGTFTLGQFMIAVTCSMLLGLLTALFYMYRSQHTRSLALSLVLIPAIEAVVIMMVNGNLGAGIAVAGSFALIRFRSVKGSAKELTCIFLAMAIGIVCGTGYVALAAVFTIVLLAIAFTLTYIGFGKDGINEKYLKITTPESLNYDDAFEDILNKYASSHELISVKTLNLGSLYRVEYDINLKDPKKVKDMIDELRTHNGNLEIMCGSKAGEKEEL
ncbi:MAG: DUF4956 domain-containing protein [Erysipelotrichaceae bacterium]|nr:DUF4956 domain-containing protein [Erysipelotrichaceae bacterium]